mgnify:CR=1 FL=1
MKISVIIPVYNEAATCIELINKVKSVPIDKEIIVDDTFKIKVNDLDVFDVSHIYSDTFLISTYTAK